MLGGGGAVALSASDIILRGATINASGATGGGLVQVGGNFQGGNGDPSSALYQDFLGQFGAVPDIAPAQTVSIDAATKINVSALKSGNAGTAIVWSEQETDFAGTMIGTGGSAGGNGGYAEVSSHEILGFAGTVNLLGAGSGSTGTLLLDPVNVTISTGTTSTITGTGSNPETFTSSSSTKDVVNITTLQTALGSTNVVIQTGGTSGAGNITVSGAIGWSSTHSLTLTAGSGGAISFTNSTDTITAASGSLILNGGTGGVSVGAAINVASLTINTSAGVTQSASITAPNLLLEGGGAYTLTNSSNSVTTIAAATGALSFTDSAALTVGAVGSTTGVTAAGAVTLTANSLTLTDAISASGQTVTIQPLGTTTATGLGTGSGTLALTQSALNQITASTLVFGGTGSTGAMSIGGAVTMPTTITNLSLLSGGAINILTGASLTDSNSAGTVSLQGTSLSLSGPISAKGAVTLTTNALTMAAAGTIGASGQTVTIQPLTSTTSLGLGSGSGTLALTQTELNEITAATFVFGSTNSTAALTVGGAVTAPSTVTSLTLLSGSSGSVVVGSGASVADSNAGGALALQAGTVNLAGLIKSQSITVTTNSLALTAAIGASGDTLTIQPLGTTTTVGLGSGAGTLALTQAELNDITATTFVYGSAGSSGALTVGGAVTLPPSVTNLTLETGGTLSISSGASITDSNASGTLTLQGNTETIAGAITAPGLVINASGTITDTASVNVGTFDLAGGTWSQNMAATSMPTFAATNFQITGGSTFLRVYGGDGTDSPYQVFDVYGLQGMGSILGSNSYVNFQLQNNIDASVTANWTDSTGSGFVPIGNPNTITYNGTFNGQGFTISNLFINQPSNAFPGPGVGVGLFGGIDGIVENVNLVSAKVTGYEYVGSLVGYNVGTVSNSSASGTVSVSNGGTYVGGLVGDNYGSISGSWSSASVTGDYAGGLVGVNDKDKSYAGSISNSYSTGTVTGTGTNGDGGLVGENGSLITTSWSSATVSGPARAANAYAGGLVGENDNILGYNGTIEDSYALGSVSTSYTGDYAGGLVGYNPGSITQSYATGQVSAVAGTAGALVGWNLGHISQSYWDTQTSGQGGAVGSGSSSGTSGLATSGFYTASNFTNWIFDTSPNTPSGCTGGGACWVIVDVDSSLNNANNAPGGTRPMLLSEYSTNIVNTHQLQLVDLAPYANYTVANNIDFSSALAAVNGKYPGIWTAAGFVPLAPNDGTFDGQGFTISNLSINEPSIDYVGLFAENFGTVQNVNLTGVNITADGIVGGLTGANLGSVINSTTGGTVTGGGGDYVGGLVGMNYGSVSGSSSSANVSGATAGGLIGYDVNNGYVGSISNSSASGNVSGSADLGGLVGLTDGGTIITGSSASGTVTDPADAFGGTPAGGLVGTNNGTIDNSFAIGSVVGSILPANGNSTLGGLVGQNDGSISNSYATGPVKGLYFIGGLVGVNYGGITSSYATGKVTGPTDTTLTDQAYGGLVGINIGGSITLSYATGTVVGIRQVGGLVGNLDGGTISDSYSTSSVTGWAWVGGLVGEASSGDVSYSYASGTIQGTNGTNQGSIDIGGLIGLVDAPATVEEVFATGNVSNAGGSTSLGGLIGANFGTITNAYSTGSVTAVANCGCYAGGLIGDNEGSVTSVYSIGSVSGSGNTLGALIGGEGIYYGTASLAYGYWNTDINGLSVPGLGNNPAYTAGQMNTAQLQAALPTGFTTTYWGIIPGQTYPFLLWQPGVIEGQVLTTYGGSAVGAGVSVYDVINGVASASSVFTAANGDYVFDLGLNGIPSGAQILVYTTTPNGVSYQQNAFFGSASGLNIYGTYLSETTAGTSYSSLVSGLTGAVNGLTNTVLAAEVNGLGNLAINTTGTTFTIDQPINLGTGSTLVLSAAGTVTQSAAIAAPNLGLLGANATYALTNAANNVGTLAASDGTGTINFYDNTTLAIGSVGSGSIAGVTAGTLDLGFANGQGLTQSQPIIVTSLSLSGNGGTYTLTNALNSVASFAASVGTSDAISLTDSIGLDIGSIDYINGVTAGTLTLNDAAAVTQSQNINVANLELLGTGGSYALTLSNTVGTLAVYTGDVSLTDANALTIGTAGGTTGVNLSGTLTLDVNGAISDPTAAVSVNAFILNGGNWSQVGTLPTFMATTDFELNGGSFLRATGGDGSTGNPYTLVDVYGLQGVTTYWAAGPTGNSFNLAATIDASGTVTWNGGAGFVPIGGGTFQGGGTIYQNGTFDGKGFSITDLYINLPYTEYVGLFGYLGATVQNVNLINADITGYYGVGALAGFTSGYSSTIINSSATGTVTAISNVAGGLVGDNAPGDSITNSWTNVSVSAGNYFTYAGGLTGFNDGTISNSYAIGAVQVGPYGNAGGLTGENDGTISNSYATGAVQVGLYGYAGGLVGYNDGTISQAYATGSVTGTNAAAVGGLVGGEFGGSITDAYATTGNVSGGYWVGGLVGESEDGGTITNVYASNQLSGAVVGGLVGGIDEYGSGGATITNGYWNTDTAGNTGIGQDYSGNAQIIQGLTSGELNGSQAPDSLNPGALPGGFNTAANGACTSCWGIVPGQTYPLFTWQPGVVSGTVYSTYGGTNVGSGTTVADVINGTSGAFTVTTDPNGNYLFYLGGGLVSGTQVVVYTNSGVSYEQATSGGVSGLNIYSTYLSEMTTATTASALANAYAAAVGSASLPSVTNLLINATGTSFAIDTPIVAGTFVLSSAGPVTQSQPITATTGLDLLGTGASYTLNNTSNSISALAANVGSATLSLDDSISLTIGSIDGTSGVTAGTLNLSFAGGQGVTQSQPITVTNLSLSGSGGAYTLTDSANSVVALAASDSTGSFSLTDTADLALGSVTAGTLTLNDAGTVTQTSAISATNLELLGTGGTYALTNTSNSVGTLAANTGSVSLNDASALTIGTAGGTTGLDLSGGTLTLAVNGAISDPTAALTVNAFILNDGNWKQIGALPTFSATSDFELNNGSTFLRAANSSTTGIGSLSNPYQLTDIYGLQGVGGFLTKDFELANTIDATGTANWNGGAGFVPIGTDGQNTEYTGTFNGQNLTVENLMINLPGSSYIGLFGSVGLNGTVENVGLTNVSVTGDFDVAGLAGENEFGTITSAYVTGEISGDSTSEQVGGLVGGNVDGSVSTSYSTATVQGNSYVGGLVGMNQGSSSQGTISQSYATGAVSSIGTSSQGGFGGLVGYMQSGTITNAYATGSVTLGSGEVYGGGLIGIIAGGTVSETYSIGAVTGGTKDGGWVGFNDGGTITTVRSGSNTTDTDYWDNTTAGVSTGAGSGSSSKLGSDSTTTLQQALPTNFSATIWSIVVGQTFPYFAWQPTITGTVYATYGGASVGAGTTVSDLINGAAVDPNVVTNSSGGYTFVLNPGQLANSQLLVYTSAGAAYDQNASGSVSGLNVYGTYLSETTPLSAYSAITAPTGLPTAIGGNSAAQTLVSGLSNLNINATASSFTIDQAITTGSLVLNGAGAISDPTAPIDVNGIFTLASGNWSQNQATLPSFFANDFRISGGTFLRAIGGTGASSSPYLIADVYGLQGISSLVSNTTATDSFALANDIDASGTTNWNAGAGFAPINVSLTGETFTFNGQNNGIFNLTVNQGGATGVGLFGTVNATGNGVVRIENVGVVGGSVTGGSDVGALIGDAQNTVIVSDAYATATVTGSSTGTYTGGLIGLYSTAGSISLSNIFATGRVTGGGQTGGLIGTLVATGGTLQDAYATGNVSGTISVGGLIGFFGACTSCGNFTNAAVNEVYANGTVNGTSSTGPIFGVADTNNITYAYSGLSTGATALPNGFDDYSWGTISGQTPYLLWQPGVIAGFAAAGDRATPVAAGTTVNLTFNGASLGSTQTDANGAYSFYLGGDNAPGERAIAANSQVFVATSGGVTYVQNAYNNVHDLSIYSSYFGEMTSGASLAALDSGYAGAISGLTGLQTEIVALPNIALFPTSSGFTIDTAISAATLAISPPNTNIALGSGAGLVITQSELNDITATTLVLGGTTIRGGQFPYTPSVTVGASVTLSSAITNLVLASGSSTTIGTGATLLDPNVNGEITLQTNSLTFASTTTSLVQETGNGGTVAILPASAVIPISGTTVTMGLGTGTGAQLVLSAAGLSEITATNLIFGGTNVTTTMTVGGAVTVPSTITNLSLLTGNSLTVSSGAALTDSNANATVTLQGGSIGLAGSVSVTGTNAVLILDTTGSATQTAGTISATDLALLGAGATYTLTDANAVGTLAASVGTGSVDLNNGATNLSIGTVAGTVGVTAATLQLADTATTTQTGAIAVTDLLLASSGGTYTLSGPTVGSNDVGTLAASIGSGTINLNDGANSLSIGTVSGTAGVAAGTLTLSDSASVTQSQTINVSNLELLGGGTYTLTSANSVGTLAVNSGSVSLTDATGLTIGTAGGTTGVTTTGALTLNVTGTISDPSAAVSVGTFKLSGGKWTQNQPTLPAFSATNFILNGGSFLRVIGGNGSTTNGQPTPWLIADVYGLQGMLNFQSSSFALAGNVDASATANWTGTAGWNGGGFQPVGQWGGVPFTGTFNGNGYTISNLYISHPTDSYVGMFGYVNGGTIENVTLANENVTALSDVGGLVGEFYRGTISSVAVSGTVQGQNDVGGLVGFASFGTVSSPTTIEYSLSSANVTGTGSLGDVGGLVGLDGAAISQSAATGNVDGVQYVGGLVGYLYGTETGYLPGSVIELVCHRLSRRQ